MSNRIAFLLLVMLALALVQGCGSGRPDRVPVSGQILLDGKPLDGADLARIQIVPDNARPAIGKVGKDGRFTLTTFDMNDGCVPGTHRAAVIYNTPIGERGLHWLLPKKYADPLTSGLTVTIDGATEDLKVELTWGGGRPFDELFY